MAAADDAAGPLPLRPELVRALERGPGSDSAELRELGPDALLCRPFEPPELRRLSGFVEAADARRPMAGTGGEGPNSMHAYGATLEQLGLQALGHQLLERLLQPLGRGWFGLERLDALHGFCVHYAEDRDQDLALHVDQSDLTLNLCLDGPFEGGDLELSGARCMQHLDRPAEAAELRWLEHEPGQALVHRGSVRHRVLPLESGRRRGLILWARDASGWAAGLPRDGCGPLRCALAREPEA